jgi:hypothetical protein
MVHLATPHRSAALLEKLRITPRTADGEVTTIRQQVIDKMAKMGFICSPMPGLVKASGGITEQQDQLKQVAVMAHNFTEANKYAFNHLKEKMSNKVDECVRTCSHFLGPFIEKRQSRAATKDALSLMEAWILSIETFGRKAQCNNREIGGPFAIISLFCFFDRRVHP